MTTKRRGVDLAVSGALMIAVALLGLILNACQQEPAVFKDKDTLLRPTGYREWVFVGSSLGLRYVQDPAFSAGKPERYHNVYINPSSFRAFEKTGQFPDGTVMILELVSAGDKASVGEKMDPAIQGSFQSEFVPPLEASVKDSQRFDTVWAYFSFNDPNKPNEGKLQPKEACWSCHHANAATDHVFTQFYPVLRAAAP